MNNNRYRIFVMIAAPKYSGKATDLFFENKVPLHYTVNDAKGLVLSLPIDKVMGLSFTSDEEILEG
ncbi:MAG: hypothetical protein IJO54_07080 [Oscillospiraceae bacterium]|nr:hypothetical protein [Oscillospiraceae bacterium]